VLLVGKYDFTPSPNSVSLWINPSVASLARAAPRQALFCHTGTDGFTIDRFNIRQNTAASVPAAMQWDELRVGNSWASITPPDRLDYETLKRILASDGSLSILVLEFL